MSPLASWFLLAASAAQNGGDAVAACRAAHAADPAAHIACLEAALRGDAVPAPTPVTTPAATQSTTPAPTPAPVLTTPAAPTGLGAEQLRENRPVADAQPVTVRIVKATYGPNGRGYFLMEDGQLWHETETTPDYQRLAPDKTYSARIERGKLRGYRMFVDGVTRMIKVERLK